jgi:hypothetical protein
MESDWSGTIEQKLSAWGVKNLKKGKIGPLQWARIFATYHVKGESEGRGIPFDEHKVEALAVNWKRVLENLLQGQTSRTQDKVLMKSIVGWSKEFDTAYQYVEMKRLKVWELYSRSRQLAGRNIELDFALGGSYQAVDVVPFGDVTNSVVRLDITPFRASKDTEAECPKVDIHFQFGPDNQFKVSHMGYAHAADPHLVYLFMWDALNDTHVLGTITRGKLAPCPVGNICVTLGQRQFEFLMEPNDSDPERAG